MESARAPAVIPESAKSLSAERNIPLPFAGEPLVPMTPDLKLTPEARAAADNLGIRDIDLVWHGFRAHHIKKSTPPKSMRTWIQGEWGWWISHQPKFQRADDRRDAARLPPKQQNTSGFKPKAKDPATVAAPPGGFPWDLPEDAPGRPFPAQDDARVA